MTDSNITSRLRKLRFGRRTSPTRSVPTPSKASSVSSQKSQTRLARIDIYSPLTPSAREIRLLHILPEQPGSLLLGPDPISCVLSHVSLDDKPTYHALSYAWDDESLGQSFEDPDDLRRKRKILISGFIFLDGQAVEVTPNLWAALWHLRRGANWFKGHPDSEVGEFGEKLGRENPGHFTYETPIWIDALCINQLDVVERNDQVQLMGSIYRNAQCVHSWTGLAVTDTEDAVSMVEEFYSQQHGATNVVIESALSKLELDSTLDSCWKALMMVCRRQYWYRLWIVQEFILGRQCTIHVGLRAISSIPTTWFIQHAQNLEVKEILSKTKVVYRGMRRLRIIHTRPMSNEDATLSKILNKFGDLQCSDPRDKIYSLLGLGYKDYGIRVDYTLDSDTVYLNSVRSILALDRDLRLICNPARYSCQCTESQHNMSSLPSWVPDFKCLKEAHTNLYDGANYNPSGHEQAVITFTHKSNVIVCRGLHIGTISMLHVHDSTFHRTEEGDFKVESFTSFVCNVFDKLDSSPNFDLSSSEILTQRLKHTYAAVTNNRAAETMGEATFLECFNYQPHDQLPNDEGLKQLFSNWGLLKRESLFCMSLASTTPDTNSNRRPADPIFGKCYNHCREGDVIVALYGSPALLALRADPADRGRFKVLGEVCVPDFMNGQAVGMFEERDFELT